MPASTLLARWRSWSPYLLDLARMVTAVLFMQAGSAKLFAFPAAILPGGGTVQILSLLGLAGALELLGGALLLLGLWTRPAAFILSGEMAVAYFKAHFPHSVWTLVNHGELSVAYCFFFLYLSAAGAGPWSLDALRRRRGIPGPRAYTD